MMFNTSAAYSKTGLMDGSNTKDITNGTATEWTTFWLPGGSSSYLGEVPVENSLHCVARDL